jgi:hypothetical protein
MQKYTSHYLDKNNCLGDVCRISTSSDLKCFKALFDAERPFIIKGLTKNWQAPKLWNLNYFDQVVGDRLISCVHLTDSNLTAYEEIKEMLFSEFLIILKNTLINNSTTELNQKLYLVISRIMSHHNNRRKVQLPELLKDIEIPVFIPFKRLWQINLWIGAGGNKSNLHFDPEDNLLIPLQGFKKLILIPPNQTKLISRKGPTHQHSAVNVFDIIDKTKYPKIDSIKYYQTVIEPEEALYIPSGWWHAVNSSDDLNIAVNIWWLAKPHYLLKLYNPVRQRLWKTKGKWLSVLFP